MTQAKITEFLSKYVTGKSAERIGKMIYDLYGAPSESGQSNPIPPGGVVKAFNDAVLGPDVKDDIVKLSLLIKGLMGETITETEELKDAAEAAADELRETYSKIDFKSDGVHFGDELFIDPRDGGSSQSVIHGQRTLNSNDNLDDIFTQGFYFFRGGIIHPPTEEDPSVGNVPVGSPTNSMSLLIVFATNGGTVISQIILNGVNRLYFRTKTGSAEFTEWKRMMDRTDPNVPTNQECIDAGANILPFIQNTRGGTKSGVTFTWIDKTANASGYWELTGNTADAVANLYLVNSQSSLPVGIQPGKEYCVGLYCEIDGQLYTGNDIYLRIVEKRQNDSDIDHIYFAGSSNVSWTVNDNCTGIVVGCYVKRGPTFSGAVKFLPSIRSAWTNAELTEKTRRMRVREIAAEIPEDPPLTGLYFDADKMFVGAEQNNNKEILHYQGVLTANNLLADIKEAGIYAFTSANHPLDSPTSATSCVWAIVSPTGKYRSLILINTLNRMYHRSWDGAAWTDWHRVNDREETGGVVRDVPKNSGVYNAYRRAHQLIDMKFDPSLMYKTDTTQIPAGTSDYIGIPHSSVKEAGVFIGTDVSLRTFMTAIHNPYSLIHTECVRTVDGNNISKYEMTYRGGYGTQGPFYGTSCSSFVLYSLGFKSRWINANFEYLVDKGVLSHVKDNSASGVQLMDICQLRAADGITPTHCVLITDIYRNERGVPTEIWTAESTMTESNVVNGEIVTAGGKYRIVNGVVQEKTGGGYVDTDLPYYKTIGCRTTRRTFAGFNTYMKNNRAQLYRYNNIEDNLEYKKSDFVAVEDETEPTYEYNDAICTYAGDYAVFRAGFPVHINYVKEKEGGNYTGILIGKIGESLDGFTLPSSYNTTHSVDITEYCKTAGKYIAYLTDGTNTSAVTHFEIVDTTTTVNGSMNDLTVNFNTSAHPVYIEFVSERGNQWGLYELSDAEIDAGTVHLNAIEYILESIGKNNHAYAEHSEAEYYVRVKYQGEYGGVTSRMMNVVDPTKAIGIDTDDEGNSVDDDSEE